MISCYLAYLDGSGRVNENGCAEIVVKIGFSSNPMSRVETLSADAWVGPNRMEVTQSAGDMDGAEIERFMHKRLGRYRIHHEWFCIPDYELDAAKGEASEAYGVQFVDMGEL